MKNPKKIHQELYMGKICCFTAEYYRHYGKETSKGNENYGTTRKVPVKWAKWEFKEKKGWIVGFGFCFNGTLCTETNLGDDYKYFRASKRVNYVKVKETPTGRELKIPVSVIKFK